MCELLSFAPRPDREAVTCLRYSKSPVVPSFPASAPTRDQLLLLNARICRYRWFSRRAGITCSYVFGVYSLTALIGTARTVAPSSFDQLCGVLSGASGPGKRSGDWTKFRCPVPGHGSGGGDRTPSLGVRYDVGAGKSTVKCFSGCDARDVLDAVGLTLAALYDHPRTANRGMTAPSTNGLVDLAPTPHRSRAKLASVPEAAPAPESKRRQKSEPGKVVATYVYTDADDTRVGRVLRYDPKSFRPQVWVEETRRWGRMGAFDAVLYRLPAVRQAIADDELVYLVEGEKDADSAVAAGAVGTTNSGGVNGWKTAHADQLRGARVVLVADRDEAGYRGAAHRLRDLVDLAKSVRVVRARTGKDLTDHLAGGLALADLDEFDLDAELRELTGDTDDVEPPHGGGGEPPRRRGGDDEAPNSRPRYVHRLGETARREGTKAEPKFRMVWPCEASVRSELIDDNGTELVGGGYLLHLRRRLRGDDGEVITDGAGEIQHEDADVAIPADSIRDGSWPWSLPWPGLVWDLTTQGKGKALQAAVMVNPMPTEKIRRYTATGWRPNADGTAMFVHAGGAIGPTGPVQLDQVAIGGKLAVYTLAEAAADRAELTNAISSGLDPLLDLPAEIIAPIIGFAFRSTLGSPRATIHLAGDPGSGKTAITRAAGMHWFAPEMCETGRKSVFSALEKGDSLIGLLGALADIRDLPTVVDDFKGDKGSEKLSAFQAGIWNGADRTVGQRDGGQRTSREPAAGPFTTGEVGSVGSSATRAITIRVEGSSLAADPGELFTTIDGKVSRYARGTIGASYLQWVAGRHRDFLDAMLTDEAEGSAVRAWRQWAKSLDQEPGVRSRLARTASMCSTGWSALLSFLLDQGAITEQRAVAIWEWAMAGIAQQLTQQDAAAVDGPKQLLDVISTALTTGQCYLSNRRGTEPDENDLWDPSVYGWSPRAGLGPNAGVAELGQPVIWQSRGDRIGILTEDEVWLMPSATLAAARRLVLAAGETFPHSPVSLGSAMEGRGWLTATDNSGSRAAVRKIGSKAVRVWVLKRHLIDGDDPDQTPTPKPPTGPLPPPPWSSDAPTPEGAQQADDEVPMPADDAQTTVREAILDAFHTVNGAAPCTECGRPTTARVGSIPAHLACAYQGNLVPDAPAAPAAPIEADPPPVPADTHEYDEPVTDDAQPDQRWRASLAVVTGDALVLPDGTHHPIPDELVHLGELAELAHHLRLGHGGDRASLPSPGQLLLTTDALDRLGIGLDVDPATVDRSAVGPLVAAAGRVAVKAAVHAGWHIGREDKLRVFTRVWRAATDLAPRISVEMVLAPVAGVYDDRAILNTAQAPEDLARQAQRITDAIGSPWGASGGATGLRLLHRLRPARGTALAATEYVAPGPYLRDPGRVPVRQWAWTRKPTSDELAGAKFLHAWDARAMYLAGAGAAVVGVGAPIHDKDGATPFDHRIAGFWRIKPGSDADWRLPSLLHPNVPLAGTTAWYPTPVLRYLTADLGEDVEILESYIWPDTSRRFFQRWADTLNASRVAASTADSDVDPDAAVVRAAIAATYKGTVGRLARLEDQEAASPLYRPDWRLTIQAVAHTNLLRKLRSAGQRTDRWPVAVSTDEVFYLSDSPDPDLPEPMRLGDGLGCFRHTKNVGLTDEMVTALSDGRLPALLKLVAAKD